MPKNLSDLDDEEFDGPLMTVLSHEEKVLEDYAKGGIQSIDLIRASGYSIDSRGNLRDNFGDIVSSEYAKLYIEDDSEDPTSVFFI